MSLIPNWKEAWKWFSVQLAVAGAALQALIIAFPGIKDLIGDKVAHYAGLVILAGVVLGRLVSQTKPDA